MSQVVSDIRGFVMKQRHDIGKEFSEMSGPYVLKEEYKDARMPTNFWSLEASTRKQLLVSIKFNIILFARRFQRSVQNFQSPSGCLLKAKTERILKCL